MTSQNAVDIHNSKSGNAAPSVAVTKTYHSVLSHTKRTLTARAVMLAAVCALLLGFAGQLQAQLSTATMFGTITDSTGAAVPNAKVTLVQTDTNFTRTFATKSDGSYREEFLPIGPYSITVEAPGFKSLHQAGIVLAVMQIAELTLKLEIGATSESINVTADVPLVNLGSATLGRTVSNVEIDSLPLVGRNVYQLFSLTPGVQSNYHNEQPGLPGATRLHQWFDRRLHRPGILLSRRRPQHDRPSQQR